MVPTSSSGFFLKSSYGSIGNFEVISPVSTGGLVHYVRFNDESHPRWGNPPEAYFGAGDVTGAAMIQSDYVADPNNPEGGYEVIAVVGGELYSFWRESVNRLYWRGPFPLNIGAVAGVPGFIQGSYKSGASHKNYELVIPLPTGGFAHWFRNNELATPLWTYTTSFGSGVSQGCALIESTYGALEVVARVGDQLVHYWRAVGVTTGWSGATIIGTGVTGTPAFIQRPWGSPGNFDVVCPLASGGLKHWYRDNSASGTPWRVHAVFGNGIFDAVGMTDDRTALNVVARSGSALWHFYLDPTNWQWKGPFTMPSEATCDGPTKGQNRIPHYSGAVGTHSILLRTGKVLFFSFGDFNQHEFSCNLYTPSSGALEECGGTHENRFCSGHTVMPDGTVFAAGGHHGDVPEHDVVDRIHTFDPSPGVESWSMLGQRLNAGRWYPTCTTLADGRVFIISGSRVPDAPDVNETFQIFHPATGLSAAEPVPSPFGEVIRPIALYPFSYLLPDGKVLVHSRRTTRFFDPSAPLNARWDGREYMTQHASSRSYPTAGTSVLLPLLPSANPPYRARVMVVGGTTVPSEAVEIDTPATNTAEILDLGDANPAWRYTQPMSRARVMPDSVLLPDGKVLVVNGSARGLATENVDPVYEIELFDPASETWTTLCTMRVPRLYHSTAILLPDGRVAMAGRDGLFNNHPYNFPEKRVEIFSPPYLFAGPRPVIDTAPASIGYDATFDITSSTASSIASAVLMRAGSVTHSLNFDQRSVGLTILSRNGATISLKSPPNANIAPPGFYLLFVLNSAGVPCVAKFVQVG